MRCIQRPKQADPLHVLYAGTVLWAVVNELLLQPREFPRTQPLHSLAAIQGHPCNKQVMSSPTRRAPCAGAVLWTVANELLLQPREYTAFSLALDRLRDDPRVMVALGSPVSGYGQETRNRAARQRIPHRVYTDDRGVEHVQARNCRPLL